MYINIKKLHFSTTVEFENNLNKTHMLHQIKFNNIVL